MYAPSDDRPHSGLLPAYPALADLQTAVTAKDWDAVTAFFGALTTSDEVSFAVSLGADLGEDLLERVAKGSHHRSLARLLLASRYIGLGWEARTSARAKYVTREQFKTLYEYLRKAERILVRLTAEEPDNVPAWDLRLTTALGLELGQAEARRRYRQAAKADPHSFQAQSALLQQLAPKWSGSLEAMHAFAKECAEAAPEGSLCSALVPLAHIEHWLDLPDEQSEEYLRQPQVQMETAAAAARGVLHPSFRPTLGEVEAHNAFAFVFSVGGNTSNARPHFQAVGLSYRGRWCYLSDPAASFLEYRAAALAGM